ncbi:hypothetical protein Pmani_038952 [Petrolisthes manimaculis]|uniref:Uncharacterized protein n=1 Tax=Petrolisthes manimaculis TaxID=1843537 RepID=A0AAE1TK10_9EUCA|nr:hypothetical protein Pmani_038952 [Petrolisthes manimaculis]
MVSDSHSSLTLGNSSCGLRLFGNKLARQTPPREQQDGSWNGGECYPSSNTRQLNPSVSVEAGAECWVRVGRRARGGQGACPQPKPANRSHPHHAPTNPPHPLLSVSIHA